MNALERVRFRERLLNLVKLVTENIKIRLKAVIVHGLFERGGKFEFQLKQMGVRKCIQNVDEPGDELLEMNIESWPIQWPKNASSRD